MIASCTKLGPIQANAGGLMPAQAAYEAAIAEARERAAQLGADSIVLLDDQHSIRGLSNYFLINATALKCY